MKIAYAEHPLTKAEKKAFLQKGFDKVIDIRFVPEELPEGCKTFKKPKPKSKA